MVSLTKSDSHFDKWNGKTVGPSGKANQMEKGKRCILDGVCDDSANFYHLAVESGAKYVQTYASSTASSIQFIKLNCPPVPDGGSMSGISKKCVKDLLLPDLDSRTMKFADVGLKPSTTCKAMFSERYSYTEPSGDKKTVTGCCKKVIDEWKTKSVSAPLNRITAIGRI